jgi:hypothetical protein
MAFKYQSTLNIVITLLLLVGVGFVAVWTDTMKREYIKQLNLFVFKVCSPLNRAIHVIFFMFLILTV